MHGEYAEEDDKKSMMMMMKTTTSRTTAIASLKMTRQRTEEHYDIVVIK